MAAKGEYGFSDYLVYTHMAAPGIMALKNGSFLVGYEYAGPDYESATKAEVEHISAMANSALRKLGNGWMVHFEAIRRSADSYPTGRFSEPTNALVDMERRAQHKMEGAHFDTRHYLFFTYLPPAIKKSGIYKKAIDFFVGKTEEEHHSEDDKIIQQIENVLADVKDVLGQNVKMRRLGFKPDLTQDGIKHGRGTDELLNLVNYIVNGYWQTINLTEFNTSYLDVAMARDMMLDNPLQMEESYISVVSVMGYPMETYPNMLAQLMTLPYEFRWSNRCIFSDLRRAQSMLEILRKKWAQKTKGFFSQIMQSTSAPVNQDAVNMIKDVSDATEELTAGWVGYGQHTSVVIARAKTKEEASKIAHEAVQIFVQHGFSAHIETLNAFEAFLGSLPGHGYENVRKPYISTLNLTDIVPLSSEWTGSEFNPSPEIAKYYKRLQLPEKAPALLQATSTGSTPFRLNIHVSDLGHTIILGPSGSGKSTLLAMLVSQFERYKDAQIFCFDKGYSMYPLCRALQNSIHYDLGQEDNKISLCPLADIDTVNDQGAAAEWLESMLVLQGGAVTPGTRVLISEALKILAESTKDLPDPAAHRTITDFLTTLQDESLREIFSYYSLSNTGEMLDGNNNDIKYAKLTVFELEHLFNMDSKIVVPVFLYIFQQIEKRILANFSESGGRPSLIVIDEAWLALSNPIFSSKIKEWLKVLRKNNCAVVLATQSINDIVNSPIVDAVLDSCETRILLPNPNALSESMKEVYMKYLSLNEQQVAMIAHAIKKREYYYACETINSHRLFNLTLGPVALSFVGSSGKEDLSRIRQLENMYGQEWPMYWLKERELGDWADKWAELYRRYQAASKANAKTA